jgi:hypothetical protein
MDQNIRIVVIEVDRPVGKRDQFRLFFRSNQTPAKCVSYAITEKVMPHGALQIRGQVQLPSGTAAELPPQVPF